ncbi:hypothetical protein SAMN05661099_1677 [Daejeonella lutea]|uniref:Uncharacterized protein n=1 Tax=Daejeonella lutea TaxID=572036 RepID=A0A1T5BTW2_9SPHI|nr:hypothetical protein SAMN05661099_1677 [Daejeonella lutea]
MRERREVPGILPVIIFVLLVTEPHSLYKVIMNGPGTYYFFTGGLNKTQF